MTLGGRLSSSQFPDGYETIAYKRGAWLFHMLRTMMRDAEQKSSRGRAIGSSPEEPFLRALRTLRERYQGRPITTRELIRIFEEELPSGFGPGGRKSLDWFYEDWVNGTEVPALELHSVKYVDKSGATKSTSTLVSGIIKQKDAEDTLITSVPVYAVVGGKNVLLGRVFADGAGDAISSDRAGGYAQSSTGSVPDRIVASPLGNLSCGAAMLEYICPYTVQ